MVTERRRRRIQEVLDRRQPDLTLLAEYVYKPHNLSALLRTADAAGVGRVHAVHPHQGVPTYTDTSAGSQEWVEVVVHPDLPAALASLRGEGFRLIAAHLGDAVPYDAVDYTGPTCFLIGNERDGVSADAAEEADVRVRIPMAGMVESLNVSVATGILLFEAVAQRRRAGRYGRPRLPAAERARLEELWTERRE